MPAVSVVYRWRWLILCIVKIASTGGKWVIAFCQPDFCFKKSRNLFGELNGIDPVRQYFRYNRYFFPFLAGIVRVDLKIKSCFHNHNARIVPLRPGCFIK
jgi:hypothetical protein